jgi:hypothetical protein
VAVTKVIYSLLPRRMNRLEAKKYAEVKLRDTKARMRAGLPDEPMEVDPEEYQRIFNHLVSEGKKSRLPVPGRPDLQAVTQEDYWEAVIRGI